MKVIVVISTAHYSTDGLEMEQSAYKDILRLFTEFDFEIPEPLICPAI
jgi:hypothetical protein